MENSKFEKFANYQLEEDVMKLLAGGRCPATLAGDPQLCEDYWGEDDDGAANCKETCKATY